MRNDPRNLSHGQGYAKEDWDSVASAELIDEEIERMRRAREVLPHVLSER